MPRSSSCPVMVNRVRPNGLHEILAAASREGEWHRARPGVVAQVKTPAGVNSRSLNVSSAFIAAKLNELTNHRPGCRSTPRVFE